MIVALASSSTPREAISPVWTLNPVLTGSVVSTFCCVRSKKAAEKSASNLFGW